MVARGSDPQCGFGASRKVELAITPGLTAQADPALARLILENLVGNAWKFTSRTEHALIEFGRIAGSRPAAIFVRDNGAGYEPTYARKLFRPFERLHRPEEFEGAGIGLAAVRNAVERHGGRVWSEGAPGRGATFYFTLEPNAVNEDLPARRTGPSPDS